jgi:hypothetical protein
MSNKSIQCVEVPSDHVVYCPYCGLESLSPEKARNGEDYFSSCPHTLFIAHDMAFEYRSERFDAALEIVGVENDDIDLPEDGIDGLTNQVRIAGAIKFASYVPAPSFYGTYIGFAPIT